MTFSPRLAPENGAALTVKVGAVVYVELVEAEKYLSWPTGTKPPPRVFPWAAARSSDPSVLQRMALCPSRAVSTLPLVVYAFRALRTGTAKAFRASRARSFSNRTSRNINGWASFSGQGIVGVESRRTWVEAAAGVSV